MVIGLSKGPKKATKKNLKNLEEKVKSLEQANKTERLQRLKSLGVFIKLYNMSHLLVTRYSVKENFGIESALKKYDSAEKDLKEAKEKKKQAELESKKKDNKDELKKLQDEVGAKEDARKTEKRNLKETVGREMLDRFMQGFVSGKTQEEKEKEESTYFLFKKLNF